ncbi:MAG: RNase adapter RapZ [Eubacteriales bacterium]|nr:RNase adapter RapZ [Eubacteriales bacterium]
MEFIILSGLSGAGKSTAAKFLEDMGFFCIDNVPPDLLSLVLQSLAEDPESKDGRRYCLVTDIRSIRDADDVAHLLAAFPKEWDNLRVVFLEATDQALLSRYKQSRRNHPLAGRTSLVEAIQAERKILSPLRERATDIIDTSGLSTSELRDLLLASFTRSGKHKLMRIFIQSFGFKHGLPLDSDIVYDVRFIPNPYYRPDLRYKLGLDPEVKEYIFDQKVAREYLDREYSTLKFLLPYYHKEGKMRLNLAVGCTGGQHRSVAFAEALRDKFQEEDYQVFVDHRDLKKAPSAGL